MTPPEQDGPDSSATLADLKRAFDEAVLDTWARIVAALVSGPFRLGVREVACPGRHDPETSADGLLVECGFPCHGCGAVL